MATHLTVVALPEADDELTTPQVVSLSFVVALLAWQVLTILLCLCQCYSGAKARMRSREGREAPWTTSSTEDEERTRSHVRVKHLKKVNRTNKMSHGNEWKPDNTKQGSERIMAEMYARAAPVLQDVRRAQNEATGTPWENYPSAMHGTFSRSSRTPRNPPSRTS